jgi:hypothetical protein
MGKRSHDIAFNWNRVFPQLLIERLADCDDILFTYRRFPGTDPSPEPQSVEVVEPATVPNSLRPLGSEIDGARKHSLKTLDQTPVVNSVRRQT